MLMSLSCSACMISLFTKLNENSDRWNFRGKKVGIVLDNAGEHSEASRDQEAFLRSLDSFGEFAEHIREEGGTVEFIFAAPSSPQLNLCEYYNRTLRMLYYREKSTLEYAEEFYQERPRGQVQEGRTRVMVNCLRVLLQRMYERRPQTNSFVTLLSFLRDVIEKDGYLDYHKLM